MSAGMSTGHSWSFLAFIGLALAILLQTAAGVLSKQAALSIDHFTLGSVITNPWYGAMLGALALQASIWVLVLRRLPLSIAYPLTSLVFPATLGAAWMIFGEAVHLAHIGGTAVIFAGIFLVTYSPDLGP